MSAPDGWMPIETAPLYGDILVWGSSGYDVAYSAWEEADGSPVWFNGDVVVRPTHWMPLPPAPVTA